MEEPKNNEIITAENAEKVITDNWLQEEVETIKENTFDGERKPSLQLEENKTVKLKIDFSQPFEEWKDVENNTIKKIIPVKVGEVDLIWWLNVKNPIYGEICKLGLEGQTEFNVLQTGNKQNTKYLLVD